MVWSISMKKSNRSFGSISKLFKAKYKAEPVRTDAVWHQTQSVEPSLEAKSVGFGTTMTKKDWISAQFHRMTPAMAKAIQEAKDL